ncbi:MAG: adenylate/guanylate cyclase domain-containing protein [Deltaproteobacteria bacterium]|nr:adenylate/guanylate cyclase domain-containing protein [Deltaproteobacteria bacterium]
MGSGEKYGIEIAQYDQLVDRLLSSSQEWLLILFHYSQLPWWVLVISLFYKLIFWSRGRLGFGSENNPWILSNLTLVFGVIGTIAIFINMLVNLDTPYGFMLPIAPILTLLLSGGLSMWLSRTVRNQKLPKYQVETEFISPLLWTRVFQIACFAIITFALSIGGFEALAESFLSIGLMSLFGIYSLSRQRKLETMVDRRTQDLQLANKRNESLLHNVLPVSIAERLKKDKEEIIADDHHQVSILFADIAGFTAMSSEMNSGELVKLLSLVFARFDTLAQKHGVEKIKTIGDAYMVAAGVPTERSDHAHALAGFALDIQRELKIISQELGRQLDIRIGIHSGAVTAGVIGTQKFAYDLWGDTVNTASRMESNGKVGAIQISEETKVLLEDAFAVEQRGKVSMKGKGELMTYFLLGTWEQS